MLLLAGLWFAAGFVIYALAIWLNPEAYEVPKSDWGGGDEVFFKTVFTIGAWPLAIVYYGINRFRMALLRSKKEKLKARAELEKELAAARREVDDLLRGIRR